MSSVLYEGRAGLSEIADIPGMLDESWKTRLAQGIKANGKSQREVSLAAKLGQGYVNSLLKEGKDPTIENLVKVCAAANLSLSWVLFGVEMSRETEELIQEIERSGPARRAGLLQFLRGEEPSKSPTAPQGSSAE